MKPRKPIRRQSKKRAAESRIYRVQRLRFLDANPWCAWGLKQSPPRHIPSTDIHHVRGRAGALFLNELFWLAVSREGHQWIGDNPKEAEALGLVQLGGRWGKQGD